MALGTFPEPEPPTLDEAMARLARIVERWRTLPGSMRKGRVEVLPADLAVVLEEIDGVER